MARGEPVITINGQTLTNAEAIAVRVAVTSFAISLRANGLGDDEHGQAMVRADLSAIDGIDRAMYSASEGRDDAAGLQVSARTDG
jgi:hypothetical protein